VAQEFIAAGVRPLYAWNSNTSEIEFMREINGAAVPAAGELMQSEVEIVFIIFRMMKSLR
jgi:hypothetical protein